MQERFTLNGKLYKTVECKNSEEHCEKCAFLLNNECESFNDDIPRCEATERADGKNVYFLEVKTNFDKITVSPETLAEQMLYLGWDGRIGRFFSGIARNGIRHAYKTREEAVSVTLEWLKKEVEE